MTARRRWVLLLAVLTAVLVPGAHAAVATGARSGPVRVVTPLWDGVEWTSVQDSLGPSGRNQESGPIRYHVIRITPDATVRLAPVVSNDAVGHGVEAVSAMCARAGGIVCVNGSFPVCPSCHAPFGGLVSKFEILQSPTTQQNQLTVRDGRLSNRGWALGARLEGVRIAAPPSVLDLDGINTGPADGAVVLHTKHFGTSTGAPVGSYELEVGLSKPLSVGATQQQAVLRRVHTTGNAPIPVDGAIISGVGHGAFELWRWTEANLAAPVALTIVSEPSVETVLSGHPVLVRDGQRMNLDPADAKVVRRHPRTAIGWNEAGARWIIVVDGRSENSLGMDLAELSELFLRLGATEAMNLDGGGSSTLSRWCAAPSWCVENVPSDGRERSVPTALAVVPADR